MKPRGRVHRLLIVALIAATGLASTSRILADVPPTAEKPWRALHVISYTNDESLGKLEQQLPQLAALGINCLILEVNYGFEFQSHPELR